jgi:hypothetical protein
VLSLSGVAAVIWLSKNGNAALDTVTAAMRDIAARLKPLILVSYTMWCNSPCQHDRIDTARGATNFGKGWNDSRHIPAPGSGREVGIRRSTSGV